MKISKDLVKYLERKGTWDSFRSEYNEIHGKNPSYANTFAGMLEIARRLNTEEVDYLVIGGLAVVSHLYRVNPGAFKDWRGTDDIDLLVPDKKTASRVLKSVNYNYAQTQSNKQGMVGKLYDYLKEDDGETTHVGLRTGVCKKTGRDITNKLIKNSSKIPVYGVQISVPQLRDLISMKKWANRDKDNIDISTLNRIS